MWRNLLKMKSKIKTFSFHHEIPSIMMVSPVSILYSREVPTKWVMQVDLVQKGHLWCGSRQEKYTDYDRQ